MFVTIYDGEFPSKEYSNNIHIFKCSYVVNDDKRYVLFDYVIDYENLGEGNDMIIGDGGKIHIWLKQYNFSIEKRR